MCSSFTVNAVEIQQRCVNTALKQTVHVFTSQCLGIKHSLMTTLVARWKKQTSFRSTVTCTLLVTQTNLQSTSFRCLTETWTESSISTTTSAYWVLSLGDHSKKNTNVRKRVPPSLPLDFIGRCLMDCSSFRDISYVWYRQGWVHRVFRNATHLQGHRQVNQCRKIFSGARKPRDGTGYIFLCSTERRTYIPILAC